MAKPDFQPHVSYEPKTDRLVVVNVENTANLKGQWFDHDVLGFWNGKRLVSIAMNRASHHMAEFMQEQSIASPGELTNALDKIGEEQNLSRRGAARRFINDVINGSGFDEYRQTLGYSQPQEAPFLLPRE